MFTGIITHLGSLKEKRGSKFTFSVDKSFCDQIKNGTSIAVNGVCLTVIDKPTPGTFAIEIMPETQKKTMFGKLQKNNLINLELPVTPQTLLSGHIVQGHVDATGKIGSIIKEGNSKLITVHLPESLTKFIIEKGSIALNGISLTVITVASSSFTVGIIPYTWTHTMLHETQVGDLVNIEVDVLAKYIEKQIRI